MPREFKTASITHQGKTVEITSPYNFVPLNETPKSDFSTPDLGLPNKDGLCGELEVTWKFTAPVLIGKDENKDNKHTFTLNKKSQPIIQGSTLRGAIRSVVEIITNSKMTIVDRDAHFAVRDLEDKKRWTPFSSTQVGRALSFGWLIRENHNHNNIYSGWKLIIVKEAYQLKTESLQGIITLDFEMKSVGEKYANLHYNAFISGGLKDKHNVKSQEEPHYIDTENRVNIKEGWLVFTGHDPATDGLEPNLLTNLKRNEYLLANNEKYKKRKTYSTFFKDNSYEINEQCVFKYEIPESVILEFFRSNSGASDNQKSNIDFWLSSYLPNFKKLKEGESKPIFPFKIVGGNKINMPGIPVFIGHSIPTKQVRNKDGENINQNNFNPRININSRNKHLINNILPKIKAKDPQHQFYLSLSRLVKIPYRYSVGDVLTHTGHKKEVSGNTLDFSQSLFGRIIEKGNEQEDTLKGRIFFSDAIHDNNVLNLDKRHRHAGSSSPKASFFPYYLAPKDENGSEHPYDYSNEDSRIAGWKRYMVQKGQTHFPPPLDKNSSELFFLEASPADPLLFISKIKFHNITQQELSVLIWALKLGKDENCFHLIGRGKPQGYGKCQVGEIKIKGQYNGDGKPLSDGNLVILENDTLLDKIAINHLKEVAREADDVTSKSLAYPSLIGNNKKNPHRIDNGGIKEYNNEPNDTFSKAILDGYVNIKKAAKKHSTTLNGRILPLLKTQN